MSRRTVTEFRPFSFEADFAPPRNNAPEKDAGLVSMPLAELAALGAQLRAEADAAARAPLDAAAVRQLEAAMGRLERAMDRMGQLADQLERACILNGLPLEIRELARAAARDLHDGQGDLFAACQSLGGQTGSV